jgi:hypothetical protein
MVRQAGRSVKVQKPEHLFGTRKGLDFAVEEMARIRYRRRVQ